MRGKDETKVIGRRASDETPRGKTTFGALLVYGAVWVAMTAVVALAVISLVDGDESVTLPPVREIELTAASERAGCVLRTGDRVDASIVLSGPAGRPADPGFYEDPPPDAALVGALRRGIIVIHYRRDLPTARVRELEVVQKAVPAGTIVTPNDDMAFAVAVTAWRQLLGCGQWTKGTIDAVRLFRGRYIGRGASGS